MFEQINGMPEAYAQIKGSDKYPNIQGTVYFYQVYGGTIVMAEINGLPDDQNQAASRFYAFHIHEGMNCGNGGKEAFVHSGMHYNPKNLSHPDHLGDLPPLLSTEGFACCTVYTGRFYPEEIIGRTIIIHSQPDDFRSQPSGDSGEKIACGVIEAFVQ